MNGDLTLLQQRLAELEAVDATMRPGSLVQSALMMSLSECATGRMAEVHAGHLPDARRQAVAALL